MWLFTKAGFISAVAHRDRPGFVLVRARRRAHLEALLPLLEHEHHIEHSPGADYPYRVTLPKVEFAVLVAELVADIDYPNFKHEAARGGAFGRGAPSLHQVWAAMKFSEDAGSRSRGTT